MKSRRYLTPSGLSLAADIGGDPAAQPVIMLHGGGQTRYAWGEAAKALVSSGFHVISLDLRGHGESDWDPNGDYGIDAYLSDLQAIIASVASPPALVGASLGGIISILYAGEPRPHPVSAVVLVDVTPRVEADGAKQIRDFMLGTARGFASVEAAADAVAAYLPHRTRPQSTAGLQKNLRRRDDGLYYWHWDPRMLDASKSVRPHSMQTRMEAAAQQIDVPTLLVRGSLSELVSAQSVAEFRRLCPKAEFVDVPGAAHMVAGDRNTAFNAAVIEFLQRRLGVA